MRHIDAAEEAVPVGVVGLRFPEMDQARLLSRASCIGVLMHAQHLFVLIVDLVVAHQEVAPETAAHKLQQRILPALFQLVQDFAKSVGFLWWQRPLGHFNVGGGGDVDATQGGMLAGIFSQRYAMQPLVIALQRGEELFDPARTPIGSPAVGAGLGPTPKFLAIVSHDTMRLPSRVASPRRVSIVSLTARQGMV